MSGVTPVSMRDARDALDRELLARGEIDELLAGYVDEIVARCRVRCRAHGEDVAQQVCMRLWRELKDGKHRDGRLPFRVVQLKVTGWICREFGGAVFGGGEELDERDGPAPDDFTEAVAAHLDLEAFVASLPPGDAEVARLRLLEGREIDEIAAETGKARNAVDQSLWRIRGKLREWLDG